MPNVPPLQHRHCAGTAGRYLLVALTLIMLLVGCNGSGDHGSLVPQTAPNPQAEQQAITNLLDLYRTALVQEDSDRLEALLQSATLLSQAVVSDTPTPARQARGHSGAEATPPFLDIMTAMFRTLSVTTVSLEEVQIAADRQSVAFREVQSVEDPTTLVQRTSAVHTVWRLAQRVAEQTVTVRIAAVQRDGPVWQVTTPGQLVAGQLTRVEVADTTSQATIVGVDMTVPETGVVSALTARSGVFRGTFTPPVQGPPQPLRVQIRQANGDVVVLHHAYRLRHTGEGVVQHLRPDGLDTRRFFTVAVAPDSTVWFGGEAASPGTLGTLVQVAASGREILRTVQLANAALPEAAQGRIEHLAVDGLGRVHALFLVEDATRGVVGNGDVVLDPTHPEVLCQTVNAFDPGYPLQAPDIQTGALRPSPSTRVVAADAGAIWLFGSDGGVARVSDGFRDGICPAAAASVRYDPILRRTASGLPTNTVPALVAGPGGSLRWLGTALGVVRVQDGQFTPLPFTPGLAVRGNAATLEAFFQEVAAAIFAAQPLTTVRLGEVSFVDVFGGPLMKEDLIFSAVEDAQGRLWVGTLGGGLRRLEGTVQTRHLTRQDGLSSNIIFGLAVGPDGALWAATDKGVDRLQEVGGQLTITPFARLNGLALPVRAVAVGADGTAWLATDEGAFRILPDGGRVQGVVQDPQERALAGVEVTSPTTPFRAVTDATGHFVLAQLPPGDLRLRVDGRQDDSGPHTYVFLDVVVPIGEDTLAPVVLVPLTPGVRVDPAQGGRVTFPTVPEAVVDVPAAAMQFPAGVSPELSLTLLPITTLPVALPVGFRVGAAAELQPDGTTFAVPAGLTLPNQGGLPAGQAVTLLRLEEATLTYVAIGRGRVSDDGRVITTTSGGLQYLSTVVFASTPRELPSRLLVTAGDRQTGVVGTTLPSPLTVTVVDQGNNPVPGIPVTFTIVSGQGQLGASVVPASPTGQAATTFTLGLTVGTTQIVASVVGLAPVVFAVTSVVGLPGRLLVTAGDGQTGVVGTTLPIPLTVTVVDQGNNPVSGITVTFTSATGQGQMAASMVSTSPSGEAATQLTLGTIAGTTQVIASVAGLAPVIFTVIGQADRDHARLLQVSGNNQSGRPGEVLPEPLVVRLEDQFGNRLVGVTVIAEIRQGVATFVVQGQGQSVTSQTGLDSTRVESAAAADDPDETPAMGSTQVESATDSQGEARFFLRLGAGVEDVVVAVSALAQTVRFVTIVGLSTPTGVAVARDGTLFVVDLDFKIVVRVDPRSGATTVVSGLGVGSGPPDFVCPVDIAVEADGHLVVTDMGNGPNSVCSGDIPMVTDIGLGAVVRVDPVTGNRVLVGHPIAYPLGIAVEADGHLVVGQPPNAGAVVRINPVNGIPLWSSMGFNSPSSIAVEANGSLVVTDIGLQAVVRVHPVTGGHTIVFHATPGDDPPFLDRFSGFVPSATGVAIETDGSLVVVDSGRQQAVRLHPDTGKRMVVSDKTHGMGPLFVDPEDIAVEADGSLVVVDGNGTVVRVNPATGDRTRIVTGPGTIGSGPPFVFPTSMAIDEADGSLVVTTLLGPDFVCAGVLHVDPQTGIRTVIADATHGSVPCFLDDIAVAADGSLVIAASFPTAVLSVPPTGASTVIADATHGRGPLWVSAASIAVDKADGSLVVVARDPIPGVVRVDPRTGVRSVVSGCIVSPCIGSGPPFVAPASVAVDAVDGSLVIVDRDAVLRVDPRTGIRTIVAEVSSPASSDAPADVAVAADGSLLVADCIRQTIIRVNPRNGDSTIVSSLNTGSGQPLACPGGIAIDTTDGSILVVDPNLSAIIRVHPDTGARTIVSR